jgi:hypothetical protein
MVGLHGIAHYGAQMLWQLGYPFDWTVMWPPWGPLKWLVLLFGIVTLCPNSLELMRRFRPALDFPVASPQETPTTAAVVAPSAKALADEKCTGVHSRFQRALSRATHLGQAGLAFDGLTAVVVGVLFTLGAMAIGHATKFLYGAF